MADVFADNSSDFASRADLADQSTRFCIQSVDLVTQKSDGKVRWWLKIHYNDESMGVVTKTLTFDQGTGKRDENFRYLMEHADNLPQHDLFLERTPLKGGKTYYGMRQDRKHGQCPCSRILVTSNGDELGSLDEDPF